MSNQYTAWNGQQYQGYPPSGWHQATDGRWWAPDTGPHVSQQHISDASTAQQPGRPNAKRAGLILSLSYLFIAVCLIGFAMSNRNQTTDYASLTPSERTDAFRTYLEDQGIPIKPETTDIQLRTLGEATCDSAAEAENGAEWNRSLNESAQRSSVDPNDSSQLSDEQARDFLNTSLRIYCPDEASRLGIS